jgi:5-(carboxyamino)imidazole ribonucleotide synthase
MVNLVGAEGFGNVVYENMEKILGWTRVTPHIYGKKMTRPFGNGHIVL